jgi:Domain of unknown function (DUF4190)/GYF domain 2
MYRIVGADGQEYGPVNIELVRQWIAEGRINAQTLVRMEGTEVRKTLAEFPELAALLPGRVYGPAAGAAPAPAGPPPYRPVRPAEQSQGLAVTSLILGILSLVGCSLFTGIPAVICGHIARSRSNSFPERYGGAGLALAGLITGYAGMAFSLLILPAMLLPALAKAKERAQEINCMNNMTSIGLSFKQWGLDNADQFPWGVSVTNGGTKELALPGGDNIDPNPIHFEVLSNELNTPKILICPADSGHTAAVQFKNLQAANVSYQLHSGTNVVDTHPDQVLMICPIHGTVLTCDGAVRRKGRGKSRF